MAQNAHLHGAVLAGPWSQELQEHGGLIICLRLKVMLAAVTLAVTAASCSSHETSPSSSGPSSSGLSSSAASGVSRSASVSRASPSAELDWEAIGVWEGDGPTVVVGAGSRLVVAAPLSPEVSRHTEVTSVGGDKVFEHKVGNDTWFAQQFWIERDLVAFLDASLDEHRARLTLASPTGEILVEPPASGLNPDVDISGSLVAYVLGDPMKRMCATVIAATPSAPEVWRQCGRPGEAYGNVAVFGDRLSYTVVTQWESKKNRCKKVFFVDLVRGDLMEAETAAANETADCNAWSGMPLEDSVTFDVADPYAGSVSESTVYAIASSGPPVELGSGFTGSLEACGSGAFWTEPLGTTRVMAWTAAHGTRQVLAPAPDRDVGLLTCAEGRWLSTSTKEVGGTFKQTLIRADASDLQ